MLCQMRIQVLCHADQMWGALRCQEMLAEMWSEMRTSPMRTALRSQMWPQVRSGLRSQMRAEMRTEMRCQILMTGRRAKTRAGQSVAQAAGQRLLQTYTDLAERKESSRNNSSVSQSGAL